eukprot:Hpha_TRINITY_DN15496_c0_g9::TRINITY_DN15496_c0_g9_i1::g.173342::m.173342
MHRSKEGKLRRSDSPKQPTRKIPEPSTARPRPPRQTVTRSVTPQPQRRHAGTPPPPSATSPPVQSRRGPSPGRRRPASGSPLRESATSLGGWKHSSVNRAASRSLSQESPLAPPNRRPRPRDSTASVPSANGTRKVGAPGQRRRAQPSPGRPPQGQPGDASQRTGSPQQPRRSGSPQLQTRGGAPGAPTTSPPAPLSPGGDSSLGPRSARSDGKGGRVRHDDRMRDIKPDEMLLPPRGEFPSRYTVVFDLDETLVSHPRPGYVVRRPHLKALLDSVKGQCECVLWTASTEDVGMPVLRVIDPDRIYFHHVLYRHAAWFGDERATGPPHGKDLRLLGRDLDSVVLVENSLNCVRWQKTNAVMVHDFQPHEVQDKTLLHLSYFLHTLFRSSSPVPGYVLSSPSLEEIRYYRRGTNGKVLTSVAPGTFYYLKRHVPRPAGIDWGEGVVEKTAKKKS